MTIKELRDKPVWQIVRYQTKVQRNNCSIERLYIFKAPLFYSQPSSSFLFWHYKITNMRSESLEYILTPTIQKKGQST